MQTQPSWILDTFQIVNTVNVTPPEIVTSATFDAA